jgi:hypothetical protein
MASRAQSFFAATLALLFCALPALSFAQTTAAGEITIAAKWKQGEQMRYAITRTKVSTRAALVEVKYNVTAVVQAAHAKGYTVALRVDGLAPPEIIAAIPQFRDLSPEVLLKALPLDFVIETDETGNIEALKNWQEIARKTDALVTSLFEGKPPALREASRATLKALYADEPTTRQTALRDLDVLFSPLGDTLVPGKQLVTDTKMDLPLIGELAAKETYLLTLDKPRAGVYFHEFTRAVDPALFSKAVERLIGKSPPDQASKLRSTVGAMLVRDRNESELDSQTGWLLRAQRTREVVQDGVVFETSTLNVARQ